GSLLTRRTAAGGGMVPAVSPCRGGAGTGRRVHRELAMNYNDPTFWLLFAAVYAAYWRLTHRQQNDVLLVASYVFYGFWDYRFLFLILISTVIDYIGGLGVAGVELPRNRRVRLAALLVGSALVLCSNVHYAAL